MTDGTVDLGRRSFFLRALCQHLAEPLAETRRELEEAVRLEAFERVYETELLAFGPDVLADAARRSGIAAGDADYTRVAQALAQRMEDAGAEDDAGER